MVDLGDTSSTITPLAQPEPGKDKRIHTPPAENSQDAKVIDLRSLGSSKKGEPFIYFGNADFFDSPEFLPGDEVDELLTQRKVGTRITRARCQETLWSLLYRKVLDQRIRLRPLVPTSSWCTTNPVRLLQRQKTRRQ
jgi:hypothetical protein